MKRFLCICGLAIGGIMTVGCASPPIVSLADGDPVTAAANTAHERLAPLPGRSLLDEYRRATIDYVPQDNVCVEEVAPAVPESPIAEQQPFPVEQESTGVEGQPTLARHPPVADEPRVMLRPEMPRVSFRQAILQPVEAENTQALKLLRTKPIQDISLDIRPPELVNEQNEAIALPQNEGALALPALAQNRPFTRGDLVAAGYQWHPSPAGLNFCYQPLYFEEVNLERFGRSHGILQPFVSAADFYGRIPLLPYMAFARPARRCTMHAHWTLPGYKIGRWEPQPIVPSVYGGAAETAALFGIILLIP